MGRDDRMGRRYELEGSCQLQFYTRDDDKREHEVEAMNLSSNAIALRVPLDHPIVDDYGELISGPAHLSHPVWADDPTAVNWRQGFLSLAQRFNSASWKWIFFFNKKYPVPEDE